MADDSTTVAEVVVTAAAPLPAPPARQVTIYQPRLSCVLKKTINRSEVAADVNVAQRVQGAANAEIDLAPYLGAGYGVMVRRTVRGPDSGMFSIRIPDQMNAGQLESFYGLIEPMDVIEIRMARNPTGDSGTASLPIVLRGFVTEITRSEAMTERGPQRFVTVTGHDYSKILSIMRVIYLPTMIVGQDLLTPFGLALNYDVNAENYQTAAQFVTEVSNNVLGNFIERLQASTGLDQSPVMELNVEATSPADTSDVSPFGTQGWQGGTIMELLTQFGDVGAWQELFVEDRDDGPYLVYRPVPFKDVNGDWIQSEVASLPTRVAETLVEGADLISLNASRTDANLGNYYWCDAPQYQLIGSPIMQQDQSLEPSPSLTDYQNCDPAIYGTRLMRVATQQGARYDGQPEGSVTSGDVDALSLNNSKRQILIDSNKDNVVFESGEMRLKGNEAIKAGNYVKVRRGNFIAEYYAHTVQHDFVVGGAFTTTISFDRGTGFIQRVQRQGQGSAYLNEIGRGAT